MALIVYPAADWDSFATLADLDEYIEFNLISPKWDTLDDVTKEIYARQATTLIRMCNNITLPEDTSLDLLVAEAITAIYIVDNDVNVAAYDPDNGAVTYEKVDVIARGYNPSLRRTDVTIPPYAQGFLKQYGCTKSTGGFSQSHVGRS